MTMAIYEFECGNKKCSSKREPFDVRLPMADRDTALVRCEKCGRRAKRIEVPTKAPMVVMMKKLETSDKKIPDRMLP